MLSGNIHVHCPTLLFYEIQSFKGFKMGVTETLIFQGYIRSDLMVEDGRLRIYGFLILFDSNILCECASLRETSGFNNT